MKRIAPPGLREEVEAATLAAVEAIGPDGVSPAVIARPFLDRGVARSTIFAWIATVLKSGAPAAVIDRVVKTAVAERAARSETPAADAAAEVVALIPAPVTPDQAAGGITLVEQLRRILMNAEQVMAHAKTAEGAVRNAKLLLSAGEAARRAVDSCLRLQQAMSETAEVDKLMSAIFEEIEKESPECIQRILRRTEILRANWGA